MSPKFSEEWGEWVGAILAHKGVSPRKLEVLIGGVVSDSLISAMAYQGKVPTYETAIIFVEAMIRAGILDKPQATEGLQVAGYPAPEGWKRPLDPVQVVRDALKRSAPEIAETTIQLAAEAVQKILEENRDTPQ